MSIEIKHGDWLDVLRTLPAESVHCCVTSPPYWGLRDYGVSGQLGLERTPEEYVAKIVAGFRELRRVLRGDGVLWLNLGDSYYGSWGAQSRDADDPLAQREGSNVRRVTNGPHPSLKPKDLCGIPWMVGFALRADGWYLRQDIIWAKPNPMPESVTDRCTKSHEYIFLLTKNARYFYDAEAVKEDAVCDRKRGPALHPDLISTNGNDGLCQRELEATRNRRSVWEVTTVGFPEAHFATFPPKLVEPCIMAGTSERGCCAACGAPWERITERGLTEHDGETETAYQQGTTANRLARLRQAARERGEEYSNQTRTIGWQSTCNCGGDVMPCTVLDPFNGAGTTGLVATRLGRNYLGIELNPEYVAMSERRIVGDAPLFNTITDGEVAHG